MASVETRSSPSIDMAYLSDKRIDQGNFLPFNRTISQNTSTKAPQSTSKTISQIPSTKAFQSSTTKRAPPTARNDALFRERSSSESWDRFQYGVLVGLAIALLLNCFIGLIYCFICSKSKQEKESKYFRLILVITNLISTGSMSKNPY